MGFLDKLKEKGRGIVTVAKPEDGVAPQSAEELRGRLLSISGKGIETGEDDGEIVVSWSAKVSSAGAGGGEYEYLYRAIRLAPRRRARRCRALLQNHHRRRARQQRDLCFKELGKGQHGDGLPETVHVSGCLASSRQTEGGADEGGYKFSWPDLRDPVIDAVTGAGWTYKPKKFLAGGWGTPQNRGPDHGRRPFHRCDLQVRFPNR